MKGEYKMSLMGEMDFFSGLQIKQSAFETFISQNKYMKELIKKFGMEKEKMFEMPMSLLTSPESDVQGKVQMKQIIEE